MRILILDDDKSYGALVASACKKLGHLAQVRFDPSEALDVLQDESVDVVLVDLEMPHRPGTEVALWLRAQGHELPIAFCTGTCQDQALIAAAGAMAKVLPRVWTHADLKLILDSLNTELRNNERRNQERERQPPEAERTLTGIGPSTFASGTGPGAARGFEDVPTQDMPPNEEPEPSDTIRSYAFVSEVATVEDEMPVQEFTGDPTQDKASLHSPNMSSSVAVALGELRRSVARVRIGCSSWSLVRRLCEDLERGQRTITVHGDQDLRLGDDVMVAVALPDEMVVSIGGRVRDFRATADPEKRAFAIELMDFGPGEVVYLLALCDQNAPLSADKGDTRDALVDTNPRIPVTKDSVDLEEGAYEGEARISWGKPPG